MKKAPILTVALFLLTILGYRTLAGYRPPFGGEYTNICGSGYNATFYSCPASCNINEGWCETRNSNEWIYVFVCDGRLGECRSGLQGPFQGRRYLTSFAGVNSNKTVQIDVFNKRCTDGGWTCNESNLLGYLVWHSGTGGGGGGGPIQCNTDEVVLQVTPNPSNVGNRVTFRIAAGDASTWWRNVFSGGVVNCTETVFGWETQCTAQSPGTYTWTRYWKRCIGDINNCSPECSKSVTFTVGSLIVRPTVITLPPVETL